MHAGSQMVGRVRAIPEPRAEDVLPDELLISVVEDDAAVRGALQRLMRSFGYSVAVFPSAADFLAFSRLDAVRCMIADINMPGMSGVELHRLLIDTGRPIPTILITAYPDAAVRARALKDGVVCFLGKPFDEDDLISCVGTALGRKPPPPVP